MPPLPQTGHEHHERIRGHGGNALNPTAALGQRRLIIGFYALVKTHVGEEQEYLRVLQADLSGPEQDVAEHGLEHASKG